MVRIATGGMFGSALDIAVRGEYHVFSMLIATEFFDFNGDAFLYFDFDSKIKNCNDNEIPGE